MNECMKNKLSCLRLIFCVFCSLIFLPLLTLPTLPLSAFPLPAFEYIFDDVDHAREKSLWKAEYYEQYNHATFTEFHLFQQTINFLEIDYPLLHASLFFASNKARVAHGVAALPWNLQLEITAYNHSRFMVDTFEFAHYSGSSARRTPNDRAKLGGIANPKVNENIAINFALNYIEGKPFYTHTPDHYSYSNNPDEPLEVLSYLEFAIRAVQLWMDSPPHRRNLLSQNAVQLGTGAYFFRDSNSSYFPKFRTTQNFQWWKEVIPEASSDPLPPGYRLDTVSR